MMNNKRRRGSGIRAAAHQGANPAVAGRLLHPFWKFRQRALSFQGAADGSHMHPARKIDDEVCAQCRAILDLGIVCATMEMAAVLLALRMRSRGLAGFRAAELSPTAARKDLLDILGQYKQ